ncbi:MxaD family protein [Mycobacterium sp. MS1601]|uniref:SRPBCC family protein n=1 Tax=Mycobacterium sp. MS1601 TaxID=1936029 RepID=UPI00097935EE|nr:SRPBCC family protein [Mycobacterium sp. MS1601]AQA06544.1 MxaD family protein [Mycobacterium sp. MS1601]
MANISRSRIIAAGQQAIWDVLADFGAISQWAQPVDHSSILRAREQTIGLARRVQMGRNTVIERIVVFDPPTALAYTIEGLPGFVCSMRNRWELATLPTGFTVVTLTTTVDVGSSAPQRLVEQIFCRVAARQSDGLLAGLATQWEDNHVA